MRRGRTVLIVLAAWAVAASFSAGSALAGKPPNVVVVMTDDQTPSSVERMPWLTGQADWLRFDRAYANQPLCCPSRATFFTGQYAHRHGVTANSGSDLQQAQTIARWLDEAGYRTGLFGKYLNGFPWKRGRSFVPPGWDRWNSFFSVNGRYFDYRVSVNGEIRELGSDDAAYSTDYFADRARRFVRRGPEPFFALLAPNAPHLPAVAAPRHEGLFAEEPVDLPPNFNEVDTDQPAYYQGLDDADAGRMRSIARDKWETGLAVDEAVEALSQALESRGVSERTVLLFVSDNSFSLGSHRHVGKNCLYEECARVPMLVRYPGGETGATDSPVSNVDLAATLADLGGAEPGLPQDGRSLVRFLRGNEPWPASRDLLLEVHRDKRGVPNGWAIVTHRWKYAEHNTGERELYRLETDPYEMDNLADEPQFDDEEADLAARLAALRED